MRINITEADSCKEWSNKSLNVLVAILLRRERPYDGKKCEININ